MLSEARTYLPRVTTKAVVETELSPADRDASQEYSHFQQESAELEKQLRATLANLDETDFRALLRDISPAEQTGGTLSSNPA